MSVALKNDQQEYHQIFSLFLSSFLLPEIPPRNDGTGIIILSIALPVLAQTQGRSLLVSAWTRRGRRNANMNGLDTWEVAFQVSHQAKMKRKSISRATTQKYNSWQGSLQLTSSSYFSAPHDAGFPINQGSASLAYMGLKPFVPDQFPQ